MAEIVSEETIYIDEINEIVDVFVTSDEVLSIDCGVGAPPVILEVGDTGPDPGENYVTDEEKAALHGHNNKTALDAVTGVNTGDQDLSGYLKVGDQLPAGGVKTFYLDDSSTIADNSALSPTPSGYAETFESVSVDSDINGGIGFLERFISGPLGITSIPAGSWVFHSYAQASAVTGDNHIVTRINRRKRMDGMTGTFTGSGPTRTFTVSGGAPFVAGDATASILTASLIETPTQTAWISGYTSASQVTVTLTDPAFVNVADTPLDALYYLLFSNQSDDIASAGMVVELENTSVQGAFAVDPTDRIVAAYFAKTTSNLARNISLYHGGATRYSHIETPMVTVEAEATQQEAEAGTEAGVRKWSPLRVWQAIAAAITGKLDKVGGTATNFKETWQPKVTTAVSSIAWAGHIEIDYAGNTNLTGGITGIPTDAACMEIVFRHNGGVRTLGLLASQLESVAPVLAGTSGGFDRIVLSSSPTADKYFATVVESK